MFNYDRQPERVLPTEIEDKGRASVWCFSLYNAEGKQRSINSKEEAFKAIDDGFSSLQSPNPQPTKRRERQKKVCKVCGQETYLLNYDGVCYSCEDMP